MATEPINNDGVRDTADMTIVPEDQLDHKTRLEAKKAAQKQRQETAKREIEQRKADYASNAENPALLDILTKAKSFRDYHTKLAIDGVGARVTAVDPETQKQTVEEYKLSADETMRELGAASGLTQLVVYIENQLA